MAEMKADLTALSNDPFPNKSSCISRQFFFYQQFMTKDKQEKSVTSGVKITTALLF